MVVNWTELSPLSSRPESDPRLALDTSEVTAEPQHQTDEAAGLSEVGTDNSFHCLMTRRFLISNQWQCESRPVQKMTWFFSSDTFYKFLKNKFSVEKRLFTQLEKIILTLNFFLVSNCAGKK